MKCWGGHRQGCPRAPGPRGFTIVELLIVIAVIIMLMSILVVAINAATRTAQGTNTRALMSSIKQALVRFKGDIGYYPPVLGDVSPAIYDDPDNHDLRKLFDPRGEGAPPTWGDGDDVLPELPDGTENDLYVERIQDWYSVTTLAEYLLGYGHHLQDGFGYISPAQGGPLYDGNGLPDERPPEGIRDPGHDGVWGATTNFNALGDLASRMRGVSESVDIGKVYGPYLELRDEQALAGVDWDPDKQELVVTFPGDNDYEPYGPKTLVDYWGKPIRYYRRLYAPGDLRTPYRRINRTQQPRLPEPTLADVILLRPYEVDPGGAIDSRYADAEGDTTITAMLKSAEFALFSSGADRAFDPLVRYDAQDWNDDGVDYSNQDNIVELGP